MNRSRTKLTRKTGFIFEFVFVSYYSSNLFLKLNIHIVFGRDNRSAADPDGLSIT